MAMVDPKDSEELSAEQLANMTGGFGGLVCPHYKDQKNPQKNKWLDEGKLTPSRKNPQKDSNVSGDVVN